MKNYKWTSLNDNTNRHPGIISNVTIVDCTNMKLTISEYIKYTVLK